MAKYLMVLTDLKTGGITSAAAALCNELYALGHQIDILVMNGNLDQNKERFHEGIEFLKLRGISQFWGVNSTMLLQEKRVFKKLLLLLIGTLKKILNHKSKWLPFIFRNKIHFSGYDAVFAYRQCAPCYFFALECVCAKKKIGFVHGDVYFMGDISSWKNYLPQFNAVAYVSDGVRKGFVDKFPELEKNSCTAYNLFDSVSIHKKANLESGITRKQEDVFKITTVSRLENATKAIHRIPNICKTLKSNYGHNLCWYVIGDGPEYDYCVEQSKKLGVDDCLFFVGEKINPYPYIKDADVCVLPSYTEAFPMTVCESLILGTPVVVARYPAAEEQIDDMMTGIIAEQNEDSIAEKIGLLIENPELLKKMNKNLDNYCYNNLSAIKQLLKVLEE